MNPAYILVGICGAIFANSTGAGGGVVVVPLVHSLGFSDAEAVATSFGIQSFGMTMGALAWTQYYRKHREALRWDAFIEAVLVCTPASFSGLWIVYSNDVLAPAETVTTFAVFSLVLGVAILIVAYTQRERLRHRLQLTDRIMLVPIALVGGVVTAWLSVGVGEFVAFYLIMRRYDVTEAVAVAVVVSALTVWSAAPVHLGASSAAQWPVVFLAGPGAVIGAIIARALALKLGALRLKRFFGFWLVVIGIAELLPF